MSTHNLCFEQKYEKNGVLSEFFQFCSEMFYIYLYKRVFVMI